MNEHPLPFGPDAEQPLDAAPEPKPSDSKAVEQKNLSRKRVFWAIVALDICLAILLVYVIIDLFVE